MQMSPCPPLTFGEFSEQPVTIVPSKATRDIDTNIKESKSNIFSTWNNKKNWKRAACYGKKINNTAPTLTDSVQRSFRISRNDHFCVTFFIFTEKNYHSHVDVTFFGVCARAEPIYLLADHRYISISVYCISPPLQIFVTSVWSPHWKGHCKKCVYIGLHIDL